MKKVINDKLFKHGKIRIFPTILPNTSCRAQGLVKDKRGLFFINNKKALSPLVATILLLVFALVIGTITMNWGKSYVEKINEEPAFETFDSAVIISIKDIDTPLKELQIQHITGKITKEEYLEKEKLFIKD